MRYVVEEVWSPPLCGYCMCHKVSTILHKRVIKKRGREPLQIKASDPKNIIQINSTILLPVLSEPCDLFSAIHQSKRISTTSGNVKKKYKPVQALAYPYPLDQWGDFGFANKVSLHKSIKNKPLVLDYIARVRGFKKSLTKNHERKKSEDMNRQKFWTVIVQTGTKTRTAAGHFLLHFSVEMWIQFSWL